MQASSKLLLDIYDSAQHCIRSDFDEHALRILSRTVHFDSAVLVDFVVTADRSVVLQTLHRHAAPVERFHDRPKLLGSEMLNESGSLRSRDAVLKSAFSRPGEAVVVEVEKEFTDPEILAYCRKYETAHSLTLVSGVKSGGMASTAALWRAGKKDAYTAQHAYVANQVLLHIFQARQINKRLGPMPATLAARRNTTVLATLDGRMYFVEQEAIHLLQLEWKQWSPPFLPRTLIDALLRSRERQFVGSSIRAKATLHGDMISVAITAETAQQAVLTQAEARVAALAIEGLQYKEIARDLGVSPATVRNQLHTVYKKLLVSNKTELAAVYRSPVP